jgi:hypothetical protein
MPVKIIEVVSPAVACSGLVSGVAHCEQNLALPALGAPQRGQ